jgi:hypothetical protein
MAYGGFDGTNGGIGFASSSDGKNWTRRSMPIVSLSDPGPCVQLFNPSLLVESSRSYRVIADSMMGPCVVTSTDAGSTWTAPVLINGLPHDFIGTGGLTRDDSVYRIWYAYANGFHYATSRDALNWIPSPDDSGAFPLTVFWNSATGQYEGLVLGNDYTRISRP